MELFDEIAAKIKGQNKTIVFPEGEDKRILGAAVRLKKDNLVEPILLGDEEAIKEVASKNGFDLAGLQIIDPATYPEDDKQAMFDSLMERRKGKNTPEEIQKMLEDVSYFGTMLVYMGKADGMVSGAVHSTGATVRPALQIIKTKPGAHRISGAFLMIKIDPKVALLSFSTKGSAKGEMVTKVADAAKLVHELDPDLPADGELQFDAAVVPSVGELKAPDSKVAGHANVFIFPSLEAGNIGYKIAQRFGGFTAVGPILQGLNAPIADLSRGCSEDDAYKVAMITAAQAL